MTQTRSVDVYAYAARASCGCYCAVIVDDQEHRRELEAFMRRHVRAGDALERVTVEQARELKYKCEHDPKYGRKRRAP